MSYMYCGFNCEALSHATYTKLCIHSDMVSGYLNLQWLMFGHPVLIAL